LLLSNALNVLNKMTTSRSVALALLASGDTNYLPKVQSYARALAPSNLALGWPSYQGVGGGTDCWTMGYNGSFLAEYYMVTNDAQVVNGLTQYIVMTARSGTMYGCYGHGGALVMPYHLAAGVHGYGQGYGRSTPAAALQPGGGVRAEDGHPRHRDQRRGAGGGHPWQQLFGYYVQKGTVPLRGNAALSG